MRWLRLLAAGAAAALAVGFAVVPGDGPRDHGRAAVTSTSPADGATLARAPTEVELSFTGPVDEGRSHILVVDGFGAASGALRQTVPGRLSQPITVTAAGAVTVAYHVTFTDGAELAGSLRFTAPSGTAVGRPPPASGHQHDIDPVSAGLLVVDAIAALAVVVLLLRRPRRPAPGGR
ncbi:MAG: copper resistance CopC family protein [Mycobacteriales bacterium]